MDSNPAPGQQDAKVDRGVVLEPCPFCGQQPSIIEDDSYGGCGISCGTCDIMPEHACGRVGEIDRCIAAWNTRTLSAPPTPSEAGLREALEGLLGGKCPECKGWGEVAYFGEMVSCRCGGKYRHVPTDEQIDKARSTLASSPPSSEASPIPMILYCPKCGVQHIDEPDVRTPDWTNPPHRSHLCHGCGCIWRPADVATNGVASIETVGKADTWSGPNASAVLDEDGRNAVLEDWEDIATLDFDPTPDNRIIVWHPKVGQAIATARYGQHGVGSAIKWRRLPAPPVQSPLTGAE